MGDQQRLLDIYLGDHLAGATAGVDLARRMADQHPLGTAICPIAAEIDADRRTLNEVMASVGAEPSLLKVALGWIAEKGGRLKLNGRLFVRSPLSGVLELEGLIVGVSGKLQLWRALGDVAQHDSRLSGFDFAALGARAEDQRQRLEELHEEAVSAALEPASPGTCLQSPTTGRDKAKRSEKRDERVRQDV